MPGPYVRDGHYVYGNMHNQPYPAYYNSSWYHRKPPRRFISDLNFFDDGSVYVCDNKPGNPDDPIVRESSANNIINIETIAFRTLRIKLYATKEEDDTDIILELGKGYSITYVTEGGLKVATGILKIIDSTIPDTCVRYIGDFNETIATAWIGIDCSEAGRSDKRKIFIASIRAIEEADVYDPDYVPPEVDVDDLSNTQKLNYLVNSIPGLNSKIDQILAKVADNDQIMAKLDELDPTEKLEYLVELINSKADDINTKLDDNMAEARTKFTTIIGKLGAMPYDDKIDYLVSKLNNHDALELSSNTSQEKKIDYIIRAINNGTMPDIFG